jgi:hypothetical protein
MVFQWKKEKIRRKVYDTPNTIKIEVIVRKASSRVYLDPVERRAGLSTKNFSNYKRI